MCTPVTTLRSSLEKHNDTFEFLLKLIPAKYYVPREDHDDEVSSKYLKHSKKTRAPKQAVKEVLKKARREKLNPANHKSVLELQQEAAQLEEEEKEKARTKGKAEAKGKQKAVEDDESLKDDDGEGIGVDIDVEGGGGGGKDNDDDDGGEEQDEEEEFVPMPEPGGIEELRKKLHARIAELRKKGNKGGEAADRDELLEERRRHRAAMRERRRKETKEKIRREAEAKGKGKEKEFKGPKPKMPLLVLDAGHAHDKSQDPQAKYTNVSYSNIAGAPQKGQHLKTTANPRQALEQMSARKEKLAGMSEQKRKAVDEKEKWAKAEAKMDGVKVRDDEARLKKAAKRKEKEKTKSKKAWGERKEQVAASMEARQKKRADNIAMRSERRKDKKARKARPGFEGKLFGKAKGK